MKYPEKLKKGATIGLVSPSSPITQEREQQCVKAIEALGFKVKKADNICQSKGGYMAGEEKVRGAWINKMFADPEVDAIICIRGGDGANRVVEFVDPDIVRQNKKIFIGYSDITSLHLLFNQQCDLVTFHGPMVSSNIVDHFTEEAEEAFFAALNSDEVYRYKEPQGFEMGIARAGHAEGLMTGGNLTVLCASIGTPYEIDTDGKILFIEEIGAHVGNMDRLVYQLRNSGKLEHVAGIVLGQYTDCAVDVPGYDMTRIMLDALGDKAIPVFYNVQSGHSQPMINLPLGAVTVMDSDSRTLEFKIER